MCDSAIELHVSSTQPTAVCPLCAQPSTAVHSRYVRRLADLPWAGIPVPNGGVASTEVSVRLRVLAGYRYRLSVARDWGSDTLKVPHEGAKLSIVRLFGLQ